MIVTIDDACIGHIPCCCCFFRATPTWVNSPISFLVKPLLTEEECPRKHQITPKRWRSRNEAKARERWMCLCETLWVRFASYRSCSQIRKFLCLCPLSSTSMSKGEGIAGAGNKMLEINSGPIFYLWNDWSVKNLSDIRSGNKERVLKAKLIFPN